MSKKLFSFYCAIFLFVSISIAQNPGEHWMQYASPEEAGWDSEKLAAAEEYANKIGSSAFMIIYDGKVVKQWGETERRFMCHSVRKSLLTALYGFYVDAGVIDISKTLKDLGIDDIQKLTDVEKTAKISDLLKARSGVYHSAAYETEAMKKARPKRGSHAPGTFWYYNNWDFNTSCHILQMFSEKDFFEDFKERIADPLQMEDFRLEDTYYHLEAENSQYPAYPFRLSARDMARIGQWFLQEGKWNGKQLISKNWVKESTSTYSENTRTEGRGYGYMWWTGIYGDEHPNYSAQGVGNQSIIVYPEDNVVLVNRANTFRGERVSTNDLIKLTKMVMAAKTGKVKKKSKGLALQSQYDEYIGEYTVGYAPATVSIKNGRLLMNREGSGKFYLIKTGPDTFLAEDAMYFVEFSRAEDGTLKKEVELKR